MVVFKKHLLKIFISIFISILILPTGTLGTEIILINYDENPPYPPEIDGPTHCMIREKYFYYITITDPDNDHLNELNIIFGDGTNLTIAPSGFTCMKGSWPSGIILSVDHKWIKSN